MQQQGAVAQLEERRSEKPNVGSSILPRTTKRCSECKVEKSLEDFNRASGRKDGRQSLCRECDRRGALQRAYKNARTCAECGSQFLSKDRHKRCGKCRRASMKVPCPLCGAEKTRSATTCKDCLDHSGSNNPNWAGGHVRHSKGYLQVRVSGRGYVMAHILVFEEILGRRLMPHENVHHKNGVKDDNRPENLELWSTSQPAGQRVEDKVAWAKEILSLYGQVPVAQRKERSAPTR